ncbi:hypothetical protein GCWU000341_00662 [Oribacterium sp. oral taxon 078 str. F0262]|nr:hypothetical protein GCWU000341_00662 [Oribacterium sp. oral taxon 078 str. F0262]
MRRWPRQSERERPVLERLVGGGFARVASADLPSGGISLREDSRTLRVCLMADFCALLRFFEAKDSASPGWLQPISLRETLLFEKTQVRSESA